MSDTEVVQMKERYSRNIPAVSEEDMNKLRQSRVLVAGCGGLGGFIIEYLARMGVGAVTAVDGDVFCESNLNRQILSTADNMGTNKAQAAADAGMLHALYPEGSSAASKTSLPFTPAACAALQVSMAVRYLCGRASDHDRELLIGSLKDLSFESVILG